ncbi:hypothetical protein ACVWZ6_001646 [Bradyrhizobium sp. GM6.1]
MPVVIIPSIGQKYEAKITLDHRLSVLNDE